MSVVHVEKDFDRLTLTIVAEFAAPVERVWQVWADPRQLERWWGPPGYPATFVEHDLTPGGRMHYYMTSPEGEKYHGCWKVLAVEPPRSLEVEEAFADERGQPDPDLPTGRMRVTLHAAGDRTRMEIVSTHATLADLEQVLEMGQQEGMVAALGQIEAILAEA